MRDDLRVIIIDVSINLIKIRETSYTYYYIDYEKPFNYIPIFYINIQMAYILNSQSIFVGTNITFCE